MAGQHIDGGPLRQEDYQAMAERRARARGTPGSRTATRRPWRS